MHLATYIGLLEQGGEGVVPQHVAGQHDHRHQWVGAVRVIADEPRQRGRRRSVQRAAAGVEASAAILCTGFTHFDSVNKPEWGFGTFPDVVTTTQVEQMISSGRGIRCPSDGRKPQRVAILLCVGSRDRQIGREWCSKICCTVSCNIAMEIREELPDCHVYIYYMDIRTYGLNEAYYWRSQEEFKVKYIKARIAEVTSDGQKLIVKGEDTLVKRPITIPFDMVVHAIGMDPNLDNKSIAGVFGVALQEHGHIGKGSVYVTDGAGTVTTLLDFAGPDGEAPRRERLPEPGSILPG